MWYPVFDKFDLYLDQIILLSEWVPEPAARFIRWKNITIYVYLDVNVSVYVFERLDMLLFAVCKYGFKSIQWITDQPHKFSAYRTHAWKQQARSFYSLDIYGLLECLFTCISVAYTHTHISSTFRWMCKNVYDASFVRSVACNICSVKIEENMFLFGWLNFTHLTFV